jgi:membrane fusion protein, multidrug efflux system
MNTTNREPRREPNLDPLDRNDTTGATTTRPPPQAGNHHAQQEPRKLDNEGNANPPVAPKPSKTKQRIVLLVATLIIGVAAGIYYFWFVAPYESTDDAFIEAHVTPIAPQVAGRVNQLLVQDNQDVNQGDLLLQIDPRDYQAKLDQEQAGLAAAQS